MKFEFSLQAVLNVRKHREKIQKQKLSKKLSEKRKLAKQKEKLKEKLEEHINKNDGGEAKNLHDLRRHRTYINDLHQKMEQINGNLKSIEKAVKQQRKNLASIHKKRHIMEKIKEEEHEVFLEKVSKEQRKVMDEIATQTYS